MTHGQEAALNSVVDKYDYLIETVKGLVEEQSRLKLSLGNQIRQQQATIESLTRRLEALEGNRKLFTNSDIEVENED